MSFSNTLLYSRLFYCCYFFLDIDNKTSYFPFLILSFYWIIEFTVVNRLNKFVSIFALTFREQGEYNTDETEKV
jgi:hypothetical protein